jgi:diketogulonate reductase-like aldo/keto reductase
MMKTVLSNGVEMPLIGLGMWDMYGKEAEQAVSRALEIGYRLFDTASMYQNEREAGNAIRSSGIPRSEIFLTTKVGNDDQGFDSTLRAFDDSMQRLDCQYVDLYLVHWPIKKTRLETWKALERLYTENRVRAIGVANYLMPFLEELLPHAALVPMVNQVEFSPWLFLHYLMDYCRQRGIHLQAYSPLVRGLRLSDPALVELSKKYGKSPAQLVLRWAVQHKVSVIPKSSNPQRLQENFAIFDFKIEPADMARLNAFDEGLRVVDDPMELL